MLNYWRESSSRRKRLLTIVAAFVLSFAITVSGVLTPLSPNEAQDLSRDLEQTQVDLENTTLLSGSMFIFRNNFIITMIIFVPFAGPFFSVYVMHNTGVVIAAESAVAPTHPPPLLVLLLLFLFPFAWMEFLAYSLAFSESMWLIWRLVKHRGAEELINALIMLLACTGILLVAAIIEMAFILALV